MGGGVVAACPDHESSLNPWNPGHNEAHRVTIGYGQRVVLASSATVHSIEILDGGRNIPQMPSLIHQISGFTFLLAVS